MRCFKHLKLLFNDHCLLAEEKILLQLIPLLILPSRVENQMAQFVTNLSYSWVGFGRNMSGVIEYHYNGFGISDGQYDPVSLASEPPEAKKT